MRYGFGASSAIRSQDGVANEESMSQSCRRTGGVTAAASLNAKGRSPCSGSRWLCDWSRMASVPSVA
jgi:hypothetical protein